MLCGGISRAPLLPLPLCNPSTRCSACIGSLETQGKSRVSRFAKGQSVAELRMGFVFPSSQAVPLCSEAPCEMQHNAGWKSRVCSALLSSLGSSLALGLDLPGSSLCQPSFFSFPTPMAFLCMGPCVPLCIHLQRGDQTVLPWVFL